MEIKAFRVQMYRCILDSDWIEVTPLTVVVGKNEAGKTTLLRALHKFNPFKPEPYSIDREWPRGHRKERNDEQVVCAVRFELSPKEIEGLAEITDQPLDNISTLEVTKDYAGRFEVEFPSDLFPDTLHPNDIDEICASLPELQEPVEAKFKEKAEKFAGEAKRLAHEGRFSDLENVHSEHVPLLQQAMSPDNQNPQHQNEQQYITQYQSKLQEIAKQLSNAPSIQKKAHEFVISHIPSK